MSLDDVRPAPQQTSGTNRENQAKPSSMSVNVSAKMSKRQSLPSPTPLSHALSVSTSCPHFPSLDWPKEDSPCSIVGEVEAHEHHHLREWALQRLIHLPGATVSGTREERKADGQGRSESSTSRQLLPEQQQADKALRMVGTARNTQAVHAWTVYNRPQHNHSMQQGGENGSCLTPLPFPSLPAPIGAAEHQPN